MIIKNDKVCESSGAKMQGVIVIRHDQYVVSGEVSLLVSFKIKFNQKPPGFHES